MFGHLKAEDFTNLLEGIALPQTRQAHLRSCSRCAERLASVQEVRSRIEETQQDDEYIPEPQWSEFRSDVRNALLSRSVKRDHAVHGWFSALTWKPAFALGVSMLLVFGVVLGVMWNLHAPKLDFNAVATSEQFPTATDEDLNSLVSMTRANTDVFDDLVNLDADEAQSLQMILDEMARERVSQQ